MIGIVLVSHGRLADELVEQGAGAVLDEIRRS